MPADLSRYNAHLNKVNLFYKRQISEMESDLSMTQKRVSELEKNLQSKIRLYNQDDKARLQQTVLDAERASALVAHDAQRVKNELSLLKQQFQEIANPARFVGTWLESSTLRKVHFDTFGINIPETRSRLFRLTQPPERIYGQTAVIETQYDYRTNTLWKRFETLTLVLNPADPKMSGELVVEYMLEGKTVAKASYKVECQRQAEETKNSSPAIDRI